MTSHSKNYPPPGRPGIRDGVVEAEVLVVRFLGRGEQPRAQKTLRSSRGFEVESTLLERRVNVLEWGGGFERSSRGQRGSVTNSSVKDGKGPGGSVAV